MRYFLMGSFLCYFLLFLLFVNNLNQACRNFGMLGYRIPATVCVGDVLCVGYLRDDRGRGDPVV